VRVVVRHGHFAFYPHSKTEILHFRRLFKIMLYPQDDYFTFYGLLNLPRWSQVGRPFGTTPALVNFAGDHPSDVMRANGFVYSMQTTLIVPAATYAAFSINFAQGRDFFHSPKMLIQPGCVYAVGNVPRGILAGYTGELDVNEQRTYLSSVESML
jgi:hypothetical protein